jgi:hypothetical protein
MVTQSQNFNTRGISLSWIVCRNFVQSTEKQKSGKYTAKQVQFGAYSKNALIE